MFKLIINNKELWVEGKPLEKGDKVRFAPGRRLSNRKFFTVRAANKFFAVCTYPLNMIKRMGKGKYKFTKTVMYTVIDWMQDIRGTENLIFGMGAESDKSCREMLDRLTNGESEVSHRNNCVLEIEKVIFKNKIKGLKM